MHVRTNKRTHYIEHKSEHTKIMLERTTHTHTFCDLRNHEVRNAAKSDFFVFIITIFLFLFSYSSSLLTSTSYILLNASH